MNWRTRFTASLDRQARWVANWLSSRSAFVWLVYGTIAWIPFVVLGLDPHGFLYLYVATSLSLITQVPLAMLASWAGIESKKAETLTRQSLENQRDMLKLLLDQFGEFEEELDELKDELRDE